MTLKPEQIKVLTVLSEADILSRSHLTIGPLRGMPQQRRRQILQAMTRWDLIKRIPVKRAMGAPADHFKITEKGRALLGSLAAR